MTCGTAKWLLVLLEDSIGTLGKTLTEPSRHPAMESFRTSICESVDSVLLSLIDAIESDDATSWEVARQITGDRGELMREFRVRFLELDPPLRKPDPINLFLVTNAVEEIVILFAKLEQEYNPQAGPAGYSRTGRPPGPDRFGPPQRRSERQPRIPGIRQANPSQHRDRNRLNHDQTGKARRNSVSGQTRLRNRQIGMMAGTLRTPV